MKYITQLIFKAGLVLAVTICVTVPSYAQPTTNPISLPERQCLYYAPHYILRGPFGLAIWPDVELTTGGITAWRLGAKLDMGLHTIWMDDRELPSELAPRNIGGVGYGEWIGNTLKAEFPQMLEGQMRRNGFPLSDQSSMTLYFTRNDDLLTVVGKIRDPVYLTEPLILSRIFRRNDEMPRRTGELCTPLVEIPHLDGTGSVPHYLPGQNSSLTEFSERRGIPLETVLGGTASMYPEFREILEETYVRPQSCPDHCCSSIELEALGCKVLF